MPYEEVVSLRDWTQYETLWNLELYVKSILELWSILELDGKTEDLD